MKRILLALTFALLLFVIIFPDKILLKCVEWKLQSYTQKAFGTKLEIGGLAWEEGKLLIKNGKLRGVTFSQAVLEPTFNWKKREIGGDLHFEDLRIVRRKTQVLPTPASPSLPLFTLNVNTTIRDGELLLYDYSGVGPFFQHLTFDLDHHISGNQIFGKVDLKFEEKLTTFFWRDHDSVVRLATKFNSHSCPCIYGLLAYFFQTPELFWNLQSGTINGNLDLALKRGRLLKVKGDLTVTHLEAENQFLELVAEIDRVESTLDLDFSSPTGFNGEFLLQGGRLALEEHREFWRGIWDISNLHSKISVKDGNVETSILRGNLMGMEGELLFDWRSQDLLMQMGFRGMSKEMWSLFPDRLQTGFKEAFPEDYFALDATLKRAGKGLELEGSLSMTDQNDEVYDLSFGCMFGDTQEAELVISDSFLEHVKDQFCLSQKRLGWFRGNQFPLEKFLAPFLLQGVKLDASAKIDFEGNFDERYLVIIYEGNDFHLEGPHFSLHADRLENSAVHYFDLETWDHLGFLPLKKTEYWQKNRDLHFTDASALVRFEKKKIHIQDVTAHFEELEFNGEVELSIHARDDIDLSMRSSGFSGPISSAQSLLTHFSDSWIWQTSVEGEIESVEDPLFFKYHFSPRAKLIEGRLEALVACQMSTSLFSLDRYQATIQYDIPTKNFSVREGEGALSLRYKTYPFTTPEVVLEPNSKLNFSFDSDLCNLTGAINQGGKWLIQGDPFYFEATQEGGTLTIAQCRWKEWNIDGAIDWNEDQFVINRLGCWEKNAGMTVSGIYDRKLKFLKGDIEEICWPFSRIPSPWKPQGEVFGFGTFEWNVNQGLQVFAKTSFHDLEIGGLRFGDRENLQCVYSSKHGLSLEGLEFEGCKLGRLHYDFSRQKLQLEALDFALTQQQLPWLIERARPFFSKVDWIQELKEEEPLKGQLSLEIYPESIWVYLSLKDGRYRFLDQTYDLKDFSLVYDPLELNIWTQCRFRDDHYWLHFVADSMTLSHGKLGLGEDALIATWEKQKEKGWCVKEIEGNYHGIQASLKNSESMDFSDHMKFKGQIEIDAKEAYPLLPLSLQSLVSHLDLAGHYALAGDFSLEKCDLSQVYFSGELSGHDFAVEGIKLRTFTSDFRYQPDRVDFSNFSIQDWAGHLSIGEGILWRANDHWAISMDRLQLNDFRLSRLQSPWTKRTPGEKPFFRSLFVREFALEGLTGVLGEWETFVGSGGIAFTNLPKRTLFNNILLLPTEITARIGLDLSALVPAMGTIVYEIYDGKVHFSEFKEMYSDGKRSRFYIAEGTSAYVDFEGNLSMKVRMKQYNLLMKLAEFFTISVKGTVFNPKYTFTNQLEEA